MKKVFLLLIFLSFNVLAQPVNINSADAKTIAASLKGVGIKKAQAIVKYRKTHGFFKSLDDLAEVKGVGKKTLQKNKRTISFTGSGSLKPQSKSRKNKVATKKTKKKSKYKKKKTKT